MKMSLHQKIICHVHKYKEHIIAHVNKHHKKYLFGAGIAAGRGALKIIAIIGVFLGIQMTIGRSQAANEEVQVYKELAIFSTIDDFVHQKFDSVEAHTDPRVAKVNADPQMTEINETYPTLDGAYHRAKNLNEKYRAAKALLVLLIKGHDVIKDLGYSTSGEDQQFNEMVYEFYQMK